MSVRVGINGFGRIGRLVVRALRERSGLELVHVNEVAADAATAAHLLEFDSVHGRYPGTVGSDPSSLLVDAAEISYSSLDTPAAVAWDDHGVDIVLECSGAFRSIETLVPYFGRGVQKVIVAAPVKSDGVPNNGVLNIVMGCNDHLYDPATNHIVTAASCTTNALAPFVKVLNEQIGIDAA